MNVARFAFGPRLKAHRERKGITLQDIADSTKIGLSLLNALERNDVSQWPKGIFRRAFLRSYTRAIDIPFESTWDEFVQLFPEEGVVPVPLSSDGAPLRLLLAAPRRRSLPSLQNVQAASIELVGVLIIGLAVSFALGMSAATSIAVISVTYAVTSTVLVGGSLARWYLRARSGQRRGIFDHDPVIDATRKERPALTLEPDLPITPATPPVRPRIFAVPNNTTATSEPRERRVADR